jgi:hypothetical protein
MSDNQNQISNDQNQLSQSFPLRDEISDTDDGDTATTSTDIDSDIEIYCNIRGFDFNNEPIDIDETNDTQLFY